MEGRKMSDKKAYSALNQVFNDQNAYMESHDGYSIVSNDKYVVMVVDDSENSVDFEIVDVDTFETWESYDFL